MRTLILSIALTLGMTNAALAADGAAVFAAHCAGCHSVTGASTPAGPSLKGVAHRKIAGLAGFNYSPALKAKGGAWTAATLDAFIASPSTFAPGSRMFASLPASADRAAVVAYLSGLK